MSCSSVHKIAPAASIRSYRRQAALQDRVHLFCKGKKRCFFTAHGCDHCARAFNMWVNMENNGFVFRSFKNCKDAQVAEINLELMVCGFNAAKLHMGCAGYAVVEGSGFQQPGALSHTMTSHSTALSSAAICQSNCC